MADNISPQLNQFKNKGVAHCCWRCTILLVPYAYVLYNVLKLSILSKGTRVYLNRKEEKLTSMDDNENEYKCKAADACTLSMCSACTTLHQPACVMNACAWRMCKQVIIHMRLEH